MMQFFRNLSIGRKIMAITILTSGFVLVVASAQHVFDEYISERKSLVESNLTLAHVIGINGAAALAFHDPDAANEVLAALAAEPDIISAQFYTIDGEIFASYRSALPRHQELLSQIPFIDSDFRAERLRAIETLKSVTEFKADFLDVIGPVMINDQALGFVDIQVDLQSLKATVIKQSGITMVYLIVAFILAYLMANFLQRVISVPIKTLSGAMSDVSLRGDYSHRIEPVGDDELGQLVDGFNVMIEQIHKRDIKLEELVRELKLAKNLAESATKSKSDFLANMSHEIRTPMNGVLGMTAMLLETDLTDKQKIYFDTIEKSAKSLLSIINDILDFSKVESGKMSIEKIEFDMHDCINEIVTLFESSAHHQHLELNSHIARDVPQNVMADPGRIRQVLMNLVGNAVKFTEKGSITVTVSVIRRTQQSAMLFIEVSDTGIGIDAGLHEEIFTVFSQAQKSMTQQFGGTGLGLSISKQLVELMGGEIGVDSKPGEGSSFWFKLPIELATGPADEQTQFRSESESVGKPADSPDEPDQPRYMTPPQFNAQVLVAEDNPVNQLVASEIMKTFGIEPVIAQDGRSALELIARENFDLIFMDVRMPEMDGIEATLKIRQLEKTSGSNARIPIIAFTANAMAGDREKYLEAGMDDYLSKPIELETFSELLNRWLGHLLIDEGNRQPRGE